MDFQKNLSPWGWTPPLYLGSRNNIQGPPRDEKTFNLNLVQRTFSLIIINPNYRGKENFCS